MVMLAQHYHYFSDSSKNSFMLLLVQATLLNSDRPAVNRPAVKCQLVVSFSNPCPQQNIFNEQEKQNEFCTELSHL